MRSRPAALAALVLLAACTTLGPAPPTVAVPDLMGTWTGTWGDTPLSLVVSEQLSLPREGGVYVGPISVGAVLSGARDPGLGGVLTYTVRGAPVSTSVEGRFGLLTGALVLVLDAHVADGPLQIVLREVTTERLTGEGTASFAWGPRGAVALRRGVAP